MRLRSDQFAALTRSHTTEQLSLQLGPLGFRARPGAEPDTILVTDPRGYTTHVALDERGRVRQYTTPLSRVYSFEHTHDSRLASLVTPAGLHTSYEYDDRGLLAGFAQGAQGRWQFASDAWGNLVRVRFPDDTSTEMTYVGPTLLARVRDRESHLAHFERDPSGTLTSITDFNGHPTTFHYQRWSRPDRIVRADGSREDLIRDQLGRLTSCLVNGAPWARLAYNAAGHINRIDYSDGHFVGLVYDDAGRVIEARTPRSVVSRRYDSHGRLIEENQGGHVVRYRYGPSGLLTGLTLPTGETLGFDYDPDGRVTHVADWHGDTHRFEFSATDRSVVHRSPNGALTHTRLSEAGLSLEIATTLPTRTGHRLGLQFEYSPTDQVTQLVDTESGVTHFTYDREGRLLSLESATPGVTERFAYDPNGNRVIVNSAVAEVDAVNQVLRQGNLQLRYDDKGNVIEANGDSGNTRYTYNGQNLLVAADLPDGRRIEYAYDAFARRVSKRVGPVTTRYVWAGDLLLSEITEGGPRPERRDFLFLPYSHTPLSMRIGKAVYQYHTDHRGVPRWLTDEAGKVAWSAQLGAFGAVRAVDGVVSQPLRFPGHYADEETGLHYNRARHYSPTLGRYLSRDPLDICSGLNLYTYAGNDPVNEGDPLGLWSWKTAIAVAAIVAGAALVIVAAPVVAAAVVAVAAGAAVAAGTATAAAMVVGGAALVGAGVALGTASDNSSPGQQAIRALKGAAIGAGAALTVMGAAFAAAGIVAGCGMAGGGGGALALSGAGGGSGAALVTSGTATSAVGVGVSGATAGVMMVEASGGGGGGSDESDTDKPKAKEPTKTDRIKEHLTDRDLDAARRESQGEVVARKADGTPWDHIHEVRDAQRGLLNRIDKINSQLADSNLTPAEREALTDELSEASRLLDKSEEYLPR